jgi:hypothetical protein
LFGCGIALASPVTGWLAPAKLQALTVTSEGRYLFSILPDEGASVCSAPGQFYLDFNSIAADSAYQLLLQSMLADRAVELHVTGRCALQGVAEVNAVRLSAIN